MREIRTGSGYSSPDRKHEELTNSVTVYDTTGPASDPSVTIDTARGLPRVRESWIAARNDTEVLAEPSSSYVRGLRISSRHLPTL